MPQEGSCAWQHYEKSDDQKDLAVCHLCNKSIHCKKGSTTGLSRHIASVHRIMRQTQELSADKTRASSQPSSSSEADRSGRKRTREEADEDQAQNDAAHDVAKMMAKDDFTANLIAKSSFIQAAFAREGIGAPI